MNNIGFGIFCFGEEYYFKGTIEKINRILDSGYKCYVLTDQPDIFEHSYNPNFLTIIPYKRLYKSYYDKLVLPKYIFENHDIAILIDADTHIKDYSFLSLLKEYNFGPGISYVDTLANHPSKMEHVSDLDMSRTEWSAYKQYTETVDSEFAGYETIWEYFLVINKNGFNYDNFYLTFEKLQVIKEFCDITMDKKVNGAGEGISISASASVSGTPIRRDLFLYELIKDKMISVSRRYTPRELWPSWMK